MGIAVGHIYYFLEDVFPNQRGGFKILKTPSLLRTLFDMLPEDEAYQRLPEEQPGGFEWGNQNNQDGNQENRDANNQEENANNRQ
ncbi:hypothetical protein NQ314_018154 [Rhamnusium bicolor]|uniref:Derlin n=1 Tax=Rhamnusium bicolor TaxID=1586634 RepID=A0AAV8WRN9_9CUCU|nr:hypothetical protein NQ314_018154 [Rhamnusium bicolor]